MQSTQKNQVNIGSDKNNVYKNEAIKMLATEKQSKQWIRQNNVYKNETIKRLVTEK